MGTLIALLILKIRTSVKLRKAKNKLRKNQIDKSVYENSVRDIKESANKQRAKLLKKYKKLKKLNKAYTVALVAGVLLVVMIATLVFGAIQFIKYGSNSALIAVLDMINKEDEAEEDGGGDEYEWVFGSGGPVLVTKPGFSSQSGSLNGEVADQVLRNWQLFFEYSDEAFSLNSQEMEGYGTVALNELLPPYTLYGTSLRETSLTLTNWLKNPSFRADLDLIELAIACGGSGKSTCKAGLTAAQHFESGSNIYDGILIHRTEYSVAGGHALGVLQQEERYWYSRQSLFGSSEAGVEPKMDSQLGFIRPNLFYIPDMVQTVANTQSIVYNSSTTYKSPEGKVGTDYKSDLNSTVSSIADEDTRKYLFAVMYDQCHNSGSLYGSAAYIIYGAAQVYAKGLTIEQVIPESLVWDSNSNTPILNASGVKQVYESYGVDFSKDSVDTIKKLAYMASAYYAYKDITSEIQQALLSQGGSSTNSNIAYGDELIERMVQVAADEIDSGDPQTSGIKYKEYYKNIWGGAVSSSEAWCATFFTYCQHVSGVYDAYGLIASKSTVTLATKFQEKGQLHHPASDGYEPQRGDVVFWYVDSKSRIGHIGIVEANLGDGTIVTLEGNCSDRLARNITAITEKIYIGSWR